MTVTSTDRGFTLIEMLVAMVILAIIAVLVFDGLRLGTRSWALVDDRADRSEQMRLVQGFIRTQLEQAQAFTYQEGPGEPQITFSGRPAALRWVGPFPGYVGQGGMYWFTLEEQAIDGGRRLILSYELYQSEDWERFSDEKPESVVLHEDVDEVEFAYLDAEDGEAGGLWQASWSETDRLPSLVRMRLRPADAGAPDWPELLVAPRGPSLPREPVQGVQAG